MALLDFSLSLEGLPILLHDRVVLRAPRLSDYEAWRILREESREHLTRWEPVWSAHEISFAAYKDRVKAYVRSIKRGVAAPYFMFDAESDALVGGVTLINILRGAAQSASLGYWTGAPHTRCGYARGGVQAVLDHGFSAMGLNRIEAACQPENAASIGLLDSLGFRREGYARDYLHINGKWRDHLIYAMTASDWIRR